ncbi:MAG: hypothetical protein DRG11_02295 [Epsilonproteobacteria bacterium]|nr:MAG: hypothetical protein DRG11_02295 [Campylobacterota bacterium]
MKLVLTIFFFVVVLYAEQNITTKNSQIATQGAPTEIFDVSKNYAYIKTQNIKIGTSGIIVHTFKDGDEVILAKAIVISKEVGKTKISIKKFDTLKNNSVATTKKEPSIGDIFVPNHLYSNAIIIAPDMQTYKQIKEQHSYAHFLSSDIFASVLKIDNNPTPQKKDIQKFCFDNFVAIVYLYTQNNLYKIDVNSFKILQKYQLKTEKSNTILPFYSLVEDIKKGLFSWFSDNDIGDYDKYYTRLIGVKYDN